MNMDKEEYDRKSIMVIEMVQQNINDSDFVEMMYDFFWNENHQWLDPENNFGEEE